MEKLYRLLDALWVKVEADFEGSDLIHFIHPKMIRSGNMYKLLLKVLKGYSLRLTYHVSFNRSWKNKTCSFGVHVRSSVVKIIFRLQIALAGFKV